MAKNPVEGILAQLRGIFDVSFLNVNFQLLIRNDLCDIAHSGNIRVAEKIAEVMAGILAQLRGIYGGKMAWI